MLIFRCTTSKYNDLTVVAIENILIGLWQFIAQNPAQLIECTPEVDFFKGRWFFLGNWIHVFAKQRSD